MHELAVAQGLIGQVARVAMAHDAARVTVIRLAIGPLSGVEAPLLDRAFSIARIGTPAEEARLEIETPPVRVFCPACGIETEAAVNRLLCGQCGGWQVTLRSGDELTLLSVDLEPTQAREKAHV